MNILVQFLVKKNQMLFLHQLKNVQTCSSNRSSINITDKLYLTTNKNPGSDKIHSKLLYELRFYIAKPLAKLFDLFLMFRIVSED